MFAIGKRFRKIGVNYMNELISIIVPVYNVEKYLDRCLKSIINQTYYNLQIILVDDGSTDSSGKKCDLWSKRDRRIIVIHKENGGLSSARNSGIEASLGNYIGFIDSDDWIDPKMFEVLYSNLMKFNADVSDVNSYITSSVVEYINKEERCTVIEGVEILKDYIVSEKFSCCRKLYRKKVIGDIRFPVGKINEDIATNFLFLTGAKRLVKSSLVMYYYYRNPHSITGEKFKIKDLDMIDACKKLCEYSYDDEVRKLAKIKYASSFYSVLGRYISYKNDDTAKSDEIAETLQKCLKKYYWRLIKSYLPLKKKMLITIMCIVKPKLLNAIYRMVRRSGE